MAEPLTQRHFDQYEAARKPRRSPDANVSSNAVLAEIAVRAVPRLRELAQDNLRLTMTFVFERSMDGDILGRWPYDAEFLLWQGLSGTSDLLTPNEAEQFEALAVEAGGWWCRPDYESQPELLPREEWLKRYRDWQRGRRP